MFRYAVMPINDSCNMANTPAHKPAGQCKFWRHLGSTVPGSSFDSSSTSIVPFQPSTGTLYDVIVYLRVNSNGQRKTADAAAQQHGLVWEAQTCTCSSSMNPFVRPPLGIKPSVPLAGNSRNRQQQHVSKGIAGEGCPVRMHTLHPLYTRGSRLATVEVAPYFGHTQPS